MPRPIVALLTDFGTQDHYVGSVRGAVLAAHDAATVVDVVHDLPPHDIAGGAFALEAAYRTFPAGTVFLAVVDPGVGGERRALAIDAGGYRFTGPDNGIFTGVLANNPQARIHEVTNAGLFRHRVAATFHARDIFGPVAGHLARGLPLEQVGPAIHDPVLLAHPVARSVDEFEWEGAIIQIDRFGNLTTSVTEADLDAMLASVGGDPTAMIVIVEGVVLPLVRTYSDVPEGEACALLGSSGRVEVAVAGGNAARQLGAARGAAVRLRTLPPSEGQDLA
jgi:S-adenosylmethionine hydrolase